MCAAIAAPFVAPAAGVEQKFSSSDKQWKGNQQQFIQDMLMRWRREDYAKLSSGEMRVKAQEILMGLQASGGRYTIETVKKGIIVFENVDGVLRCTITSP